MARRPADLVGLPPQGPHRGGRRRRPGRLRPGRRRSPSTRRGCTTATRSRPYAGHGPARRGPHGPGCAAGRSTGDAAAAGGCLSDGTVRRRSGRMSFTDAARPGVAAARRRRRAANDEFFAAADHLVCAEPRRPSRPHTFGAKGQVYDGWETRRRREPGPRPRDRPARRARRRPRRRRRHRVLHRQLPAGGVGRGCARRRLPGRRPSWPARDWVTAGAALAAGRRQPQPVRGRRPRSGSPTSG